MSGRLWLLLVAAACGSSAHGGAPTAPTAPAAAPAAAGEGCEPVTRPLWQSLKDVEAKPPAKPVPPRVALPAGMSLPPPAKAREGDSDCTEVGSLGALVGRPLTVCCDEADGWQPDGFMEGCRALFACRYRDAKGVTARTHSELARMVEPVTTPAQALGLVALTFPEIVDPADDDLGEGYPGTPPAFEIAAEGTGFLVRAAARATCGCEHHLVRIAFRVSRGGCVSRVDEPPALLTYSSGECKD